jgi:flagellar hook assembly protein FlgD
MINFVIPQKSGVTLDVYDMSGKLVVNLINNETKTEGSYSYEFDGSRLSSGMYVYRLSAGKFVETRKMILIK